MLNLSGVCFYVFDVNNILAITYVLWDFGITVLLARWFENDQQFNQIDFILILYKWPPDFLCTF